MSANIEDKILGAWWGAFLGDAMGMPTHGYLSEKFLHADYGNLSDFAAAKTPHPESVLYTIARPTLPPEFDYLGEKRRELWAKRGTHFHYGFQAGENTLPMFLALHLAASLGENGKFDTPKWLDRYKAVMTMPEAHNDTFIPSVHRRYFENLAAGKDPEKNGCPDAHMSDIAMFIPLMFGAIADADRAQMNLFRILKKFTIGEGASTAAFFLSEILANLLAGHSLETTLFKRMTPDRHFSLAFPYRRWAAKDDANALTQTGKLAVLEESVPLTIYIALKYGDNVKKAISVNANIGGESTGRGAIIGLLAGAQCGYSGLPQDMLSRLKYAGEIEALADTVLESCKANFAKARATP